ncbi:MAG: hypothetical protein HKM04_06370 [Legionellales bacterium]|nr:hypothetical protein [Legionellales bacterium]
MLLKKMNTLDLIKLTQNTLILTPNERLSRRLHKLYGKQMAAQNHLVWEAPCILSISNWLRQLYQEAIDSGLIMQLLLSDIQFQTLGQTLGKTLFKNKDFIQPQKTIIDMLKARKLLKQWQVNYSENLLTETYQTKESLLFNEFISMLENELAKNNYFTIDELPDKLKQVAIAKIMNVEKIIVFSFDEVTPQYKDFLSALEKKMIPIQYLDWRTLKSERTIHPLPSLEQEYYAMANWAKNQLSAGNQNIVCIVPDLTTSRPLIARIFYEVFHPQALFSSHSMSPLFNISGGEPLSNLPMFVALFNFLALFQEQANYQTISQFILSPFIAFAETEKFSRIKLDLALRNTVLETCLYDDRLLLDQLAELTPHLAKIWQEIRQNEPSKQMILPSSWINWLTQLIKIIGWPGERILNSYEFQQLEQGYTVFNDLITLDKFCGKITFTQLMQLLKETANNLPFQIKTIDAPVQVLGMLEASGNLFDCIWIAGLTDKAWPPPVKPNPYIPYELQARLNMPHGSSRRQYDYSLFMMQGWVQSSANVHFSYAEYEGDEPLSPSPLLNEFAAKITSFNRHEQVLPCHLMLKNQVEILEELPILPCPFTFENAFGSSLFQQQINCPFQAFAIQRLKSQKFEPPQTSWDRRLRGKNLHAVMEKLWKKWQHSNTLNALSEEELDIQIDEAVTAILKRNLFSLYKRSHDYFKLEKGRFINIIRDWVSIEKTRKPFKVTEMEYKLSCTYQMQDDSGYSHEINLNFRIDRIDLTDAGEWILIDYKTNEEKPMHWLNPMSKPQMPLYATHFEPHFDGIAYACLHPASQKMHFAGLSREDNLLPDVKAFNGIKETEINSWNKLTHYWEEQLNIVASDFMIGNVAIKPRTPQTCDNCHLSTLCRIIK